MEGGIMQANGNLTVKMEPVQDSVQTADGVERGRMVVQKTEGDLIGTSHAEMLYVRTPVQSSASYVAFETVTATLQGKKGI